MCSVETQVGIGMKDLGYGERSEEHTSELQSLTNLVCRLLLEKKKQQLRHSPSSAHLRSARRDPAPADLRPSGCWSAPHARASATPTPAARTPQTKPASNRTFA